MTPDAVIFDLDGTLVDSEPVYLAAEQRLLAELGVTGFDEEAKRPYVGLGTKTILADLKVQHGFTESVEVLAARKDGYYLELARTRLTVFEPMRTFIKLLTDNSHRLALASGSTRQVLPEILRITGLASAFEFALSADTVPEGKPAPDLFLSTASHLNLAPDRCVVIEDSWPGREAARRAGMRCVFVPSGPDQLRHPEQETELVFADGVVGFDPDRALRWIERTGSEG